MIEEYIFIGKDFMSNIINQRAFRYAAAQTYPSRVPRIKKT